jgi:hypothetical protein
MNWEEHVGFVLKPGATSAEVRRLFEQTLLANDFTIRAVAAKWLRDEEVDILHCVTGPWHLNKEAYTKYLTSGETVAYLTTHKQLRGRELFDYARDLRGLALEAYRCGPRTLRGMIHECLGTAASTEAHANYVHATADRQEFGAFMLTYFPTMGGQ